jgi:thiol-disulfide isomerase/thioredoxin
VRRPALAAALLVAALALAACSSASGASDGFVTGDGSVTTYAAGARKTVPDLTGPTLEGGTLSLSSYRGKVVVLNFWGSWCAPCRDEGPALENLSTTYASKGVQFVGLNIRDDADSAKAFLQNIGSTYPSLYDGPDGLLVLEFSKIVPPEGTPTTLLIDRQGKIAARIIGETTEPQLKELLAPLLAVKSS